MRYTKRQKRATEPARGEKIPISNCPFTSLRRSQCPSGITPHRITMWPHSRVVSFSSHKSPRIVRKKQKSLVNERSGFVVFLFDMDAFKIEMVSLAGV